MPPKITAVGTKPPPLVWPNGQRMQPATLRREIAAPSTTGVRQVISGHPAQGLTPQRLARLLLAAEQGDAIAYLELAEEMEEKDPHYLSVLSTRKRQVAQLPIEVVPAGESAEEKTDAELVRDWLDRDLLEFELFDMLDALGKGYSATEIVWAFTDDAWLPDRLKWRDPRFFEFDRTDGETLLLRDIGPPQPLPAAKFVVHYHQAKSGLPIRGGLARVAAWGYMFKNYAIKDWVAFLETYGMPLRIGRYDNGETEENIATLLGALADLGSDAAAAFPRTMEVEFIDGKAGTAPNDLWRSKAEYVDEQISKLVLGQTSTSDAKAGGLGSGQANVHNEVRGDIERADAKLISATLTEQLAKPMVMLNRGARKRYPRIRIGRPDEVDVAAMIDASVKLVPLGVEIAADDIRERAGLPAPKPGARLLGAPPEPSPAEPPQAPGGPSGDPTPPKSAEALVRGLLVPLKGRSGAAPKPDARSATASATQPPKTPPREPDAIDTATEEALGDWERLMTPLLGPVEAIVADAADLQAVRAKLSGAIEAMDAGEIAELLARASFGARLAGDIDVRPD